MYNEEELSEDAKKWIRWGNRIAPVLIIIILVLIFNPFYIVGAGEKGVILNFGAVQDRVKDEGLHLRVPVYQKVVIVDTKTQTVRFDGQEAGEDGKKTEVPMFAASKDLQDVQIDVVINYHQDPTKVNSIYQTFGKNYEENVIIPVVRETVKSISAEYTAEELVTKRTVFSENISKVLTDRLSSKNAILERFSVVNFKFSESFNQAIEAKVTAEQNALAAKNKLEQVKFEAAQQIEQAKGKSEAIRIEAQALKDSPQVLQLRALEKWSGELPKFIGGGATPFIDVSTLISK